MSRSGHKMGTIYPQKIKSLIRGEESVKIQVGYMPGTEYHKEGDTWTDKDGKEWTMKNGIRQSIPKLQEARIPLFCPKCGGLMKKHNRDTKSYIQWNMCFNCVIERDNNLIKAGLFQKFEEKIEIDKKYGFLNEAKLSIVEFLESIDKGLEFVNEDGKVEKWDGDEKKLKEFWEKELKDINESLIKLEKKKETLDDIFQEI